MVLRRASGVLNHQPALVLVPGEMKGSTTTNTWGVQGGGWWGCRWRGLQVGGTEGGLGGAGLCGLFGFVWLAQLTLADTVTGPVSDGWQPQEVLHADVGAAVARTPPHPTSPPTHPPGFCLLLPLVATHSSHCTALHHTARSQDGPNSSGCHSASGDQISL